MSAVHSRTSACADILTYDLRKTHSLWIQQYYHCQPIPKFVVAFLTRNHVHTLYYEASDVPNIPKYFVMIRNVS